MAGPALACPGCVYATCLEGAAASVPYRYYTLSTTTTRKQSRSSNSDVTRFSMATKLQQTKGNLNNNNNNNK